MADAVVEGKGGDMGTLLCYSVCLHAVQQRQRMWTQRPVSPSNLACIFLPMAETDVLALEKKTQVLD